MGKAWLVALGAWAWCGLTGAQDAAKVPAAQAPAVMAPASAPSSSGGGFGERLVSKPTKRASPAAVAPYTPIKPPQDDGLVPEIEMFVGESRVFPAPGVARIAVGNGGIMSAAALDSKEVILFANGTGTSSLFIWNEDGRYQRVKINIVPGDTSRVAREIAAFLTSIPNAKASIIGDKVIVEGDNLSDGDLAKISKLAERYPQILNFTNTVGWEQMVMLDVKVVEFPTSVLREMGLKWNPTGGAAMGALWSPIHRGNNSPYNIEIRTGSDTAPPITAASGNGPVPLQPGLNLLSAINMGLNAQLNLLAQDGKATVLAEPQLSARNGSSASFLAGGEIPYSVSNINGTTINFKPYGIKLDIEPRVDRNGVIRAKIEAEVSAVDSSVTGTAGGPALTTRRTKTEFNLHAGETFVLGGLLQRGVSTDIDKIPFLGDIPVLGALFRSKRFQNKETELVIFVTPTLVDAKSAAVTDRVDKIHERLRQELGERPYLADPAQAKQEAAAAVPAPVGESDAQAASQRVSRGAGGSTLQVKRDGLVLHAQPDVRSAVLLQLGAGSFVQLGRAEPKTVGPLAWRNVVVGDLNGWVLADGLAPTKLDSAAVAESAFARQDQAGQLIALQPPAAAGSAPRAGGITLSAAEPDAVVPIYRVALYKLAMRVMPDINAPVLVQLVQGDTVRRLPEPARGYWLPVEAQGQKGWVASQWLDPVGPAAGRRAAH